MEEKRILDSVKKTGCAVTVEEHQAMGGMGSAVCEILAQNNPVPVEIIGVKDRFGESGEPNELLKVFGLIAEDIARAAKKVIKRK